MVTIILEVKKAPRTGILTRWANKKGILQWEVFLVSFSLHSSLG